MTKIATDNNVPEAKIRNAIWYLNRGKTKKFVCDYLGIPYNVKKLDNIILEFNNRLKREEELKQLAKKKIFTEDEKKQIAKEYLSGASQASIAASYYVSAAKIRKILVETGTPIRSKGKVTKTDHIQQDLDTKLRVGQKVFFTKKNCYARVDKVYDEEYLDYLQDGVQRYVETYPFKEGKFSEPQEGIHYEIYWLLRDGVTMKRSAVRNMRQQILNNLEKTGREYYQLWSETDDSCFYYANREEIYPIREN